MRMRQTRPGRPSRSWNATTRSSRATASAPHGSAPSLDQTHPLLRGSAQPMSDRATDRAPDPNVAPAHGVSFAEAARFWIKLGFINFGGPTGQIAIMHDELVERRRWISNARYLHALNYCMLLPGPEAQQLSIYVGWLLHKVKGGIVAGIAFVLPAFFLMLGLSYVFVVYGDVPWVSGIFEGLSAAVVGIVAAATIRIGKKALRNTAMYLIAAIAFVSIFFLHVPFPIIVITAGLVGLLASARWPATFTVTAEHDPERAA